MAESKKLYRSTEGRMLGGVCAGIGEYLSVDPVLFRIGFGVLSINGIGIIVYLLAWLIIPDRESMELKGEDLMRANLDEIGEQAKRIGGKFGAGEGGGPILGVLMVCAGIFFLASNFIHIPAGLTWPLVIIAVGVYLLISRQSE